MTGLEAFKLMLILLWIFLAYTIVTNGFDRYAAGSIVGLLIMTGIYKLVISIVKRGFRA